MVKIWFLTPWGDTIWCYNLVFGHLFWRITTMFCSKCIFLAIKWFKMWNYWHNPIILVIFCQNFDNWPPGVPLYSVITCCFAINFQESLLWFVKNVFLWLFCIIKSWKLDIYSHNTDIWALFGPKKRIWPPVVTIWTHISSCDSIYFK